MRRRRPERREILPDPMYHDLAAAKFVNYIMGRGKKGVAEKSYYGAMDIINRRTKSDGLKIFQKAIENASPAVEVKIKTHWWCYLSSAHRSTKKSPLFIWPLNGL